MAKVESPIPGTARLWSLPEANAALGRVREILGRARLQLAGVREADEQIEDLNIVWGAKIEEADCPDHAEWAGYLSSRAEARNLLEVEMLAFAALGCEVKDLVDGLVDFRGRVGNQEVYLCWRDGESEIRWWHGLDSGFGGRKAIPGTN